MAIRSFRFTDTPASQAAANLFLEEQRAKAGYTTASVPANEGSVTWAELLRLQAEAQALAGPDPFEAFVVTRLLNGIAGYYLAEHNGKRYVLLSPIALAELLAVLQTQPAPLTLPFVGAQIAGIPIVEDEELASAIFMAIARRLVVESQKGSRKEHGNES